MWVDFSSLLGIRLEKPQPMQDILLFPDFNHVHLCVCVTFPKTIFIDLFEVINAKFYTLLCKSLIYTYMYMCIYTYL